MSLDPNKNMVFSLCVFCGSRTGIDPNYVKFAAELGQTMARDQVRLVYGGGASGLMGAISNSVIKNDGQVIGVIPDFLTSREGANSRAELIVVPDMHTRKREMFEHSDAFCVLPGGVGTLEEFLEIVTWRQLSVHNKPVILANWNGYWDHFVTLGNTIEAGGFGYGPMAELYTVVHSVADIIPTVRRELANLKEISGPGHPDLTET